MYISDYLLAPALAWAGSQLLKYLLASRVSHDYRNFRILLQSGSMPSVHSAVVTALAVALAIGEGLASPLFAIALVFGVIVAYDAMQVRRATGEQGTVLKELVALAKLKLAQPTHHALGHRPGEVAAGVLIGVASALALLAF